MRRWRTRCSGCRFVNFGFRIGFRTFAGRTTRCGQRRCRSGCGRWSLRASTTSAASTTAIAITRRSRRRLFSAAGLCRYGLFLVVGHARRWGLVALDAVADVVGNRIGKSGLKGRRLLVLPLLICRLFAPLRTVAHPSAHIALVTRSGGWRQCRHRFPDGEKPTLM